ncbi:MAG: methyltransferase domain-containing protein [Gammaproteobacteria bacterium]|nr:methyltransferase domain-containing protein [Gammaproteobacteria bacterium]
MDRIQEAYRIERDLAHRLRSAPKEFRTQTVRAVYADLYRRVHWHPDLTRSLEERRRRVAELRFAYGRWISSAGSVLEIGAGSCDFLAELALDYPGKRLAGIDVARDPLLSAASSLPANVQFTQAAASAIPYRNGSFDFVFCSQVLEHFHPDDVPDHMAEVARVLRSDGWFGFDTPNRITGPHDISRGFTPEATGLHLKEWTFEELLVLLLENGFRTVLARSVPGRAARWLRLPAPGPLVDARRKIAIERRVARIQHVGRRRLLGRLLGLNGIYLYAQRSNR